MQGYVVAAIGCVVMWYGVRCIPHVDFCFLGSTSWTCYLFLEYLFISFMFVWKLCKKRCMVWLLYKLGKTFVGVLPNHQIKYYLSKRRMNRYYARKRFVSNIILIIRSRAAHKWVYNLYIITCCRIIHMYRLSQAM